MDYLGKLHAMMHDSDNIHTLIAGDFNCSPGSRFFDEFKSFCNDNNMVVLILVVLVMYIHMLAMMV